ncbi:hypothetical protein [Parapedobacter deserti]
MIILLLHTIALLLFAQCEKPANETNKQDEGVVCGDAGHCWEIGTPQAHPFIHFDVNGGTAYYQDTIYLIGGNGSTWNRTSYQWELWVGTDIDNMTKQPTPTFNEDFPNYITQSCGSDDEYWCEWQFFWPMGLYIDEAGVFYTIAYTEYNFKNEWRSEAKERRLGLAKSFDKGKTWSYYGDIITQNKQDPPPANKTYNGAGDISFFIADDGYAYIYYKTGFYDNTSLVRDIQNISVARSPLSAKFEPGSWTKFYNGAFQEPGINGREDYIFTETDLVCITYNTYLEKFVLFGGSVAHHSYVSFCDDMEQQNWSRKDFAMADDIRIWYFWPFDPASKNPFKTGKDFRIYTTGLEAGERVGNYKTFSFHKKPL